MKKLFGKRLLAAAMSAVLLCNVAELGVAAANAQETPGLQLQTILVDNDAELGRSKSDPKYQLVGGEHSGLLRQRFAEF